MPQVTNLKRLVVHKMSLLLVPAAGSGRDALAKMLEPGGLGRIARQATEWVQSAIAAVKSAPENPYGDDDEAIASEIMRRIQERKLKP